MWCQNYDSLHTMLTRAEQAQGLGEACDSTRSLVCLEQGCHKKFSSLGTLFRINVNFYPIQLFNYNQFKKNSQNFNCDSSQSVSHFPPCNFPSNCYVANGRKTKTNSFLKVKDRRNLYQQLLESNGQTDIGLTSKRSEEVSNFLPKSNIFVKIDP